MTTTTSTATTTVFTTTSAHLLRALNATKVAAPRRPAVSCMAGLLIDTRSGNTTLTQYSYDTMVRVDLDTTQATNGTRLLIHHGRLLTTLNGLRSTTTAKKADTIPVSLIIDTDGNPSLSFAGYTMPVETLPLEDYPSLPTTPKAVARFEADHYITALSRIAPSAGGDETLPVITGAHLRISEDGAAVLEATDRYRAAQAPLTPTGLAVPGSYNLVAKDLMALVKHVTAQGQVTVLAEDDEYGMGGIQVDGITLLTRRIGGTFPSLNGFATPEIIGAITVDAKDLAKQIKVADKLATTASDHPAVNLWAHPSGIEVAARVDTAGARASAPVCEGQVEGDPHARQVAKARYLAEGVRAVGTDQVTIHYMPNRMLIVTAPGHTPAAADMFRYMLMCIRIDD